MNCTVYIALGSNTGERESFLALGRGSIAALDNTSVLAASTIEETAPIGPSGQGPYLNQMLAVSTTLAPEELLSALQSIELSAGRERGTRWGPRTLDLDIVMFGSLAIESPHLRIPHPELPHRDFWQRELAELGWSDA